MRKIEAITVCVDFADYLEQTLPGIRNAVDSVTVVTTPSDRRTEAVARRLGARVVQTTAMFDDDAKFSLGAAINVGLDRIDRDGWVLLVDADIVLGRGTGALLKALPLDERKIYGVDRVHCRGWARWLHLRDKGVRINPAATTALGLPLGDRITNLDGLGYLPCGFFQLWNPEGSGAHDFPVHPAGTAEGSDMAHAARWPRAGRELIPELIVVHLETERPASTIGADWGGRKTPEFSAEGGPYRR